MSFGIQESHPSSRSMFFAQPCHLGVRPFVHLGDDDELASRFHNSEDFAHTLRQIGPPEVRLYCGNKVEYTVRKRKLRYGALHELDSPHLNPAGIRLLACSDTSLGIIEPIDLALRSAFRQLVKRSAAATTHI